MKVRSMDWIVGGLVVAVVAAAYLVTRDADSTDAEGSPAAVRAVAGSLDSAMASSLGVGPSDLRSTPNPVGRGVVVHLPRATGGPFPRKPVWIEWRGNVHAVNGPAKELTPGLPWVWPRPEAGPREDWVGSGLVEGSTADLVRSLYGP